jgi:hypothetical protein
VPGGQALQPRRRDEPQRRRAEPDEAAAAARRLRDPDVDAVRCERRPWQAGAGLQQRGRLALRREQPLAVGREGRPRRAGGRWP